MDVALVENVEESTLYKLFEIIRLGSVKLGEWKLMLSPP